jgi:predicted enzyme related to lactoylglutathione lyase
MIHIDLASVFVDDQSKALRFYTEVLGFEVRRDIPLGEDRWLTVAAPGSSGVELLLEPNGNPVAAAFQAGIRAQGIPATTFATDDIRAEADRLMRAGVRFTMEPTEMGPTLIAVFDDTCGNLIGVHQVVRDT